MCNTPLSGRRFLEGSTAGQHHHAQSPAGQGQTRHTVFIGAQTCSCSITSHRTSLPVVLCNALHLGPTRLSAHYFKHGISNNTPKKCMGKNSPTGYPTWQSNVSNSGFRPAVMYQRPVKLLRSKLWSRAQSGGTGKSPSSARCGTHFSSLTAHALKVSTALSPYRSPHLVGVVWFGTQAGMV